MKYVINWIAWQAAVLILTVGVLILVDPITINITRLYAYNSLDNPVLVGVVFILSSVLSIFGLVKKRGEIEWIYLQQFLLVASAVGAIDSMIKSRYGDGVIRSRAFIIADQLPIIVLALTHFVMIFYWSYRFIHREKGESNA